METVINWTQIFIESFGNATKSIFAIIPELLGAIFIILIGWLVSRLVSRLIIKLIKISGFDNFLAKNKVISSLENGTIELNPSKIIGKFAFWLIFMLFIVTAAETMGWKVVAVEIGKLIAYLPSLLSALLIFIIGYYFAGLLRSMVNTTLNSVGMTGAKILSNIIFYIVLSIVIITSLNQAGIDTSLISNNISLIIGIIFGAFAISFAFAARNVLENILSGFYSKTNFKVGQKIKLDNKIGIIESIDNVQFVLKTKEGKIIMPLSKLLNESIEIIDESFDKE